MAKASWGGLQDHWQPCPVADEHEPDEDGEACPIGCDPHRGIFWGSFYEEDRGECEHCNAEDVGISDMFDGCITWVCLPCYLKLHARDCGCPLWARPSATMTEGETK